MPFYAVPHDFALSVTSSPDPTYALDENVLLASNLASREFYGQTVKYSTQLNGEVKVACTRVLAISDRWGEFTQPIYYFLAKLRSFNIDF